MLWPHFQYPGDVRPIIKSEPLHLEWPFNLSTAPVMMKKGIILISHYANLVFKEAPFALFLENRRRSISGLIIGLSRSAFGTQCNHKSESETQLRRGVCLFCHERCYSHKLRVNFTYSVFNHCVYSKRNGFKYCTIVLVIIAIISNANIH